MDVYTNWCGPCKLLDKNTFGNKDVADYINANYYAVKFNGEGDDVVVFKTPAFASKRTPRNHSNRAVKHWPDYRISEIMISFKKFSRFLHSLKIKECCN